MKASGGKRGAANLGLWFPFVGKHDGSERSCWKSPHLPQDSHHRQTDMQAGGILHWHRRYARCCAARLWPGAAKPNLRRRARHQIKLIKGNLIISASSPGRKPATIYRHPGPLRSWTIGILDHYDPTWKGMVLNSSESTKIPSWTRFPPQSSQSDAISLQIYTRWTGEKLGIMIGRPWP